MITTSDIKDILLSTGSFEENIYFQKYIELIENNLNTEYKKYETQKHHLVPKNIEKYLKKNICNKTINLKYSDHLLAHYYLCLCSKIDYVFAANYKAIRWICFNSKSWRSTNQLKELLREQLNKFMESLPNYDLIYKKAISIISEEKKKKIVINKDGVNRRVSRDDLEKFIELGWNKGFSSTVKEKMSERQKGRKLSLSTRKKMSESHKGLPSGMKGKKHSKETLAKLKILNSGINNGMYGKHHSDSVRKKLSESHKDLISEKTKIEIGLAYKDKKYSINKLRKMYKMSAKKILRVLYENNLISLDFYKNHYRT